MVENSRTSESEKYFFSVKFRDFHKITKLLSAVIFFLGLHNQIKTKSKVPLVLKISSNLVSIGQSKRRENEKK